MHNKSHQPIGLFDSGVGGLTVAHAIKSLLPDEHLVYYGDTFHLPYGDKSSESVKYYSVKISDFLLEQQCKVVLVACNTASATAYREVSEHVGDRALVMNVIDPVVEYVARTIDSGKVGVIGTKGTINSGTYQEMLLSANPSLDVVALPTPLLVPMIEEGFIFDDISNAIIRAYLSDGRLNDLDGLILGCTHYPIIRRQIEKYYNFNVNVVDSAMIVADELRKVLSDSDMLSTGGDSKTKAPGRGEGHRHHFYISDYTDYFAKIAKLFFEEDLRLEQRNIFIT